MQCANEKSPNDYLYKNVHAIVQEQPRTAKRLKAHKHDSRGKRPVSVLLVGIDSISRLHLIRSMPNTYKYIKNQNWFEFEAYNKVEDNTFPNLMAVLTGFNMSMQYSVCDPVKGHKLDQCPIMWKLFRESGYTTAFAEDQSDMSTFTSYKQGFVKTPTDHYLRPAMIAADSLLEVRKKSLLNFCVGLQHSADLVYQYAVDFGTVYKRKPHFGLFWTNTFSHNHIKDPSSMDMRMQMYLQEMERNEIFNHSVVIFLSDHGMRIGEIRTLATGWQEDRLPFLFISLPPWFQTKHPEIVQALKINQRRLITPYDLHLTLKHILTLSGRAPENMKGAPSCPKCVSLFKPVPYDRSCEDVEIDPHWCLCKDFNPVSTSNPVVLRTARMLIQFMNSQIRNFTSEIPGGSQLCEKLYIERVILARKTAYNNDAGFNDYLVTIEVNPGAAPYEATARYFEKSKKLVLFKKISRISYYYQISRCTGHIQLKKLCHCKDQNLISNL